MIDHATIDRIFSTAQIYDVVSDFVSLKKRGINYIGLCPFHNEKTPSFIVSPAKNICKCFGCGKGGSPVNFIMEKETLSYPEALRYLAKKYNIEIQEKELTPEQIAQHSERESLFTINEFARKYFSDILLNNKEGQAIGLSYFRERAFRDDTIQKFGLGYALETPRDVFSKEAIAKGFKKEFLVKTGLTVEGDRDYLADRFRGRVLFPVHTVSGKVVAFGGRVLKTDAKTAKYINSPESEIYRKREQLYGIFFAKQQIVKSDNCYLVEGYIDVISMHQAGIENVVASSGTALTPDQIRILRRFSQNVTTVFDGDRPGIEATLKNGEILLAEGMNVKSLLLPNGEDPDDFVRRQNASEAIEYINNNQKDFILFKLQLLLEDAKGDPVKRATLIKDVARSIALVPDSILRSVYVRECSKLLEIEESLLYVELKMKVPQASLPQPDGRRDGARPVSTGASIDTAQHDSIDTAQYDSRDAARHVSTASSTEREIIRCLMRYGERKIGLGETEISVARYIINDLEADDLELGTALYQLCIEKAKEFADDETWVAEPYFTQHRNADISRLASDLVTDHYTLSKMHKRLKASLETEEERLHEIIPRAIYEFKNKVLAQNRKELQQQIKTAQESGDLESIPAVIRQIAALDEIKKQLAKYLGERIIIK
jgi:DNA primase